MSLWVCGLWPMRLCPVSWGYDRKSCKSKQSATMHIHRYAYARPAFKSESKCRGMSADREIESAHARFEKCTLQNYHLRRFLITLFISLKLIRDALLLQPIPSRGIRIY